MTTPAAIANPKFNALTKCHSIKWLTKHSRIAITNENFVCASSQPVRKCMKFWIDIVCAFAYIAYLYSARCQRRHCCTSHTKWIKKKSERIEKNSRVNVFIFCWCWCLALRIDARAYIINILRHRAKCVCPWIGLLIFFFFGFSHSLRCWFCCCCALCAAASVAYIFFSRAHSRSLTLHALSVIISIFVLFSIVFFSRLHFFFLVKFVVKFLHFIFVLLHTKGWQNRNFFFFVNVFYGGFSSSYRHAYDFISLRVLHSGFVQQCENDKIKIIHSRKEQMKWQTDKRSNQSFRDCWLVNDNVIEEMHGWNTCSYNALSVCTIILKSQNDTSRHVRFEWEKRRAHLEIETADYYYYYYHRWDHFLFHASATRFAVAGHAFKSSSSAMALPHSETEYSLKTIRQ